MYVYIHHVCVYIYIYIYVGYRIGLPRWHSGKEYTCQCWRHGFNSWFGKIPWSRKWQPTPPFLPEKAHGQRSLSGLSPWGHKELDVTEWLSIHTHILGQPKNSFGYGKVLWKNLNFLADPIYYSQAQKLLGPGVALSRPLESWVWVGGFLWGRSGLR